MPRFEDAPKEMNDLMEAVYSKCVSGGGSGEVCAREAIAAARHAGWVKGDDGKWHKKEAMKELYDLPNVEIFGTGKHHGFGFDDAVIAQMVADTNAQLGRDPYVRIGHTEDEEPKDAHPRVGLLRNIRFVAGKAIADIVGIPAAVYRAIRNGGFPKRSVELIRDFRDKSGTVYPWIIDSMALIGAAHPEVKDLRDISTLYAADNAKGRIRVETDAGWPEEERIEMGEELKPQEQPKAEALPEKAPAIQLDENAEKVVALTAERDALKAELEALKAAKAGDSEKIAALEKRINEMGVDTQLDKLVHEGKLTPAERPAEKVHLMELLPLTSRIKFGEKEQTLYERRVEELSSRKPIEFKEKLPSGDPNGGDEWTLERLRRAGLTREQVKGLKERGRL